MAMAISKMRTIHLSSHDPRRNLKFEEELFESLRKKNEAACIFYTNNPGIILGRNNKAEEWVNLTAAEADNIPVIRRFSGGGTVYHDLSILNFSFILPKNILDQQCRGVTPRQGSSKYIDYFLGIIARALSHCGDGFSLTRTSDVSLHGKKISGNAQRIAGGLVLHHGTVMLKCPTRAIEAYLLVPPDRQGIGHRGFVTGLQESGRPCKVSEVKGWLAREFWRAVDSDIISGEDDIGV